MSIAKRVMEAVDKMSAGDAEGALIPASIAIDATAKKEYPNMKIGEAYKEFLHKNLKLITRIAFAGCAITQGLRVKYDHPKIIPDKNGTCSIEQIWYHVVRCGLVHNAHLPATLKFTNGNFIKVDKNLLVLPASLIYGLIFAVIASPVNSDESTPPTYGINDSGHFIQFNQLWGRKDEVLKISSKGKHIKPEQ